MVSLCFSVSAVANRCHELDITITNQTGHSCVLINSHLKHGSYSDNTMTQHELINHSESAPLHLTQSALYGPDLELTYLCGSKRVVLKSQQDACHVASGAVHPKVLASDRIKANFYKQQGSIIWSRHGEIRWMLY